MVYYVRALNCISYISNVPDSRFRPLFFEYLQRTETRMVVTLRMPDEVNLSSRWKARSRLECACTCFAQFGCTRVWFNATEAFCYHLKLTSRWIYWITVFAENTYSNSNCCFQIIVNGKVKILIWILLELSLGIQWHSDADFCGGFTQESINQEYPTWSKWGESYLNDLRIHQAWKLVDIARTFFRNERAVGSIYSLMSPETYVRNLQ